MENTPKKRSNLRLKINSVSFENFNECFTQLASDFEQFHSASKMEAGQQETSVKPDFKPSVTDFLTEFKAVAVLSPLSELAINVANTQLSTVTERNPSGKYKTHIL